jgi:hypothetical protein
VFRPEEDLRYDLTAPSTDAAELLEELIDFCNLDADAESLGDPEDAESIDPATWTALVTEVQTCFQPQD